MLKQHQKNIEEEGIRQLNIAERGLRERTTAKICEAIIKITQVLNEYSLPVIINMGVVKLADLFRNDKHSNIVRLQICRSFRNVRQLLPLALNKMQVIKSISHVLHSNDTIARTYALKILGYCAKIIQGSNEIYHRIENQLINSKEDYEKEAALYATAQLCKHSDTFFENQVLQFIEDILIIKEQSTINLTLKRKLILLLMYAPNGSERKSFNLSKDILKKYPTTDFINAALGAITYLTCRATQLLPETFQLFEKHMTNPLLQNNIITNYNTIITNCPDHILVAHLNIDEFEKYLLRREDMTKGIIQFIKHLSGRPLVFTQWFIPKYGNMLEQLKEHAKTAESTTRLKIFDLFINLGIMYPKNDVVVNIMTSLVGLFTLTRLTTPPEHMKTFCQLLYYYIQIDNEAFATSQQQLFETMLTFKKKISPHLAQFIYLALDKMAKRKNYAERLLQLLQTSKDSTTQMYMFGSILKNESFEENKVIEYLLDESKQNNWTHYCFGKMALYHGFHEYAMCIFYQLMPKAVSEDIQQWLHYCFLLAKAEYDMAQPHINYSQCRAIYEKALQCLQGIMAIPDKKSFHSRYIHYKLTLLDFISYLESNGQLLMFFKSNQDAIPLMILEKFDELHSKTTSLQHEFVDIDKKSYQLFEHYHDLIDKLKGLVASKTLLHQKNAIFARFPVPKFVFSLQPQTTTQLDIHINGDLYNYTTLQLDQEGNFISCSGFIKSPKHVHLQEIWVTVNELSPDGSFSQLKNVRCSLVANNDQITFQAEWLHVFNQTGKHRLHFTPFMVDTKGKKWSTNTKIQMAMDVSNDRMMA